MSAMLQADEIEQVDGLFTASPRIRAKSVGMNDVLPSRNGMLRVVAGNDILQRRQLPEQANFLERAR